MPETEHLLRLYKNGLSLPKIAEQVGLTKQGVHYRLTRAGYSARKTRGTARVRLPREKLLELYCKQELSMAAIAKLLDTPIHLVRNDMRYHRIKTVGPGVRLAYRPIPNPLKIGDSVIVARPGGKNPYARIHRSAKRLGYKVSIESVDTERMRISRLT
jgi:predicted DNA-binding protein YlxM (UPF0122 family)